MLLGVACRNPDVPTNGVVKFSSTVYGSVATYDCETGYVLSGARSNVCNAEGEWSMSLPTCSGKILENFESPNHFSQLVQIENKQTAFKTIC